MKGRWFRFYDAALDDPKVQRLPDTAFRAWVNLLCLAARNDGKIPESWEDLSFALRKSIGKTRELLQILISAGLVDALEGGFEPHNWASRQYVSDVSTPRVKRFRERAETVSETPPEQIQNRTEQSRAEQKDSRTLARARFQEFWLVCPKKVGKGKAEKLFVKFCETTSPDLLITSMGSFGASQAGKDPEFIVHPATWLSQRRWEDEGVSVAPASAEIISIRNAFQSPEELEGQRRMMEKMHGKATN